MVGDLGGEGDQGGRTDHAQSGDNRVERALQVGVGAGDHAAEHVARAGDGVRLEHLGDCGEPFRYRIVAAGRISRVISMHVGVLPYTFTLAEKTSMVYLPSCINVMI